MPTKLPKAQSQGEALFALHVKAERLGPVHQEYRFAVETHGRKWRFDFAWPQFLFAVEIEGVTGGEGGRHQRIAGFKEDLEKYEAAMLDGWMVYRVSTEQVRSGRAIAVVKTMLERRADIAEAQIAIAEKHLAAEGSH